VASSIGLEYFIAFGPGRVINLCQLHCVSKSVAQKVQMLLMLLALHDISLSNHIMAPIGPLL